MKPLLKQATRAVLSSPPVLSLLRARVLRGRPVTVLCYHTIGPNAGGPNAGGPDAWTVLRDTDFRQHLALLRETYDIVDLDAALETGPGHVGRPRAVLTFDDGEAGLHRHLLPLLTTEKVPVTVYVATGQIEAGQPYWFDRIMGALSGARVVTIDGSGSWSIPAEPGPARWAILSDLLETLKRVPPARREELVADVLARHPLPAGRPPLAPMTLDELIELSQSPWVSIGAHSHCHNLLDQIPEAQAEASMARSRQLLRDWTGQKVDHFAWPNGNHTPGLRKIAARIGFRSSAALDMQLWRKGADVHALPRLAIGRYDDAARLKLRLIEM